MNITYQQIIGLKPCYNPIEIGMPTDYNDTIVNFINDYRNKVKEKADILWVLYRNEFLNDNELRLYAVWCARQVQHLMTDQRSINALDVADNYARGKATSEELAAARAAAWAAASDAWAAVSDDWDDQIDKLLYIFECKQKNLEIDWTKS